MEKAEYCRYLQSPEWKQKRRAVWKRAKGICERCDRRKEIGDRYEVHHLTYDNVGDEPLSDLALYCEACHHHAHGRSLYDPCGNNDLLLYAELHGVKALARPIWKCTPEDVDLFRIVQRL